MPTQLQVRNDTAANWTSANPTLLAGEIGFETNTGYFKIGNGSTAWNSLSYAANGATIFNATTVNATTVTATAGQGFSNVVVFTSGSAATWNLPAALQVANAKFKVTVIGGGGQGGGTGTTAGQVGGGGGAGGTAVKYLTYVSGQNTATYTVGAAGSGGTGTGNSGGDSTFIYNSVTYTGGLGTGGNASGAGGAGGTGTNGDYNITGQSGANGGTMAATSNYIGNGGNTGLGFGFGGQMPVTAAGATGNAGVGYGAGGSGGRNGTGTTTRSGGAGTAGIIIIEY